MLTRYHARRGQRAQRQFQDKERSREALCIHGHVYQIHQHRQAIRRCCPTRTNHPTGGSTATDPSAAGSSPGADACTDFCLGVLMVWQKQENAWKLLARQGFKTEA